MDFKGCVGTLSIFLSFQKKQNVPFRFGWNFEIVLMLFCSLMAYGNFGPSSFNLNLYRDMDYLPFDVCTMVYSSVSFFVFVSLWMEIDLE